MADFRESGQIEQDADVAMLLYQADPKDYRSPRILKIAKNKEGRRGEVELDFDGETQTMRQHEPTSGEKYREIDKAIRKAGQIENQVELGVFKELTDDPGNLPF
jgi:hypothetical protein